MDENIYLVGVDDVDTDEDCPKHGELTRTLFPIERPDGTYIPQKGECVHYCETCLESLCADLGIKQIRTDQVLGFMIVNSWDHFEEYLIQSPQGFDLEREAQDRLDEWDGHDMIEPDEFPETLIDATEIVDNAGSASSD